MSDVLVEKPVELNDALYLLSRLMIDSYSRECSVDYKGHRLIARVDLDKTKSNYTLTLYKYEIQKEI
jgi:hypothetical protein